MIPYEELCAALERFVARNGGGAEPRTAEHQMPPIAAGAMDEEEHTSVGAPIGSQTIYDDHSNEIDVGDVITDEDVSKS
jgi:hypothetical protein